MEKGNEKMRIILCMILAVVIISVIITGIALINNKTEQNNNQNVNSGTSVMSNDLNQTQIVLPAGDEEDNINSNTKL